MKLLLATYNYPPEAYGGSEVYLEALASELARAGHAVEIVCGSRQDAVGSERIEMERSSFGGCVVWRIKLAGARFTMPELYTTRAPDLRDFWKRWLTDHRPDVLHFHGHSLAVSHSMMEAAADLNIPMVFTLHNVPMLCPKGDYITWQGTICDGRAALLKCARCSTASRLGAAAGLAMAAATPLLAQLAVPASSGWSQVKSGLHYPGLLRMRLAAQAEMLSVIRRWHVFSEWSRQALKLNGVPHEKIVLARHPSPAAGPASPRIPRGRELRLGFFGRFNKVKGIGVLLDAMRMIPDAPLRLDIFGGVQEGLEVSLAADLKAAAAQDARIVWRGRIAHEEQPAALAAIDVVVVPSTWVETGPLTVLEAFSAKLPVVGSDLSGINEWVSDGKNGWLFPAGDAKGLSVILARLAGDAALVAAARDFPSLESVASHAAKVMMIYRSLFAGGAAPQ